MHPVAFQGFLLEKLTMSSPGQQGGNKLVCSIELKPAAETTSGANKGDSTIALTDASAVNVGTKFTIGEEAPITVYTATGVSGDDLTFAPALETESVAGSKVFAAPRGEVMCECKTNWEIKTPGQSGVAMQANDVLTDVAFNGADVAALDEYYCANVQKCGQKSGTSGYQREYRFDKLKDLSECRECPENSRTADDKCTRGDNGQCDPKPGESPPACYAETTALCTDTPVWITTCLCEKGYYGIVKDVDSPKCAVSDPPYCDSTKFCEACEVNTYTEVIGKAACTDCPANSVTDVDTDLNGKGMTSIDDCLCKAGYFRTETDTCNSCAADEYKDNPPANADCTACPEHSTTMGKDTRKGIEDCICDVGYYREVVPESWDDASSSEK